jgi:hypothetical protein
MGSHIRQSATAVSSLPLLDIEMPSYPERPFAVSGTVSLCPWQKSLGTESLCGVVREIKGGGGGDGTLAVWWTGAVYLKDGPGKSNEDIGRLATT